MSVGQDKFWKYACKKWENVANLDERFIAEAANAAAREYVLYELDVQVRPI